MDVFVQCSKVETSLRRGSTVECLAWCGENKTSLKKMNVRYLSIPPLALITKTCRALLSSSFAYSNISSWFEQVTRKKLQYTLRNFSHHMAINTSGTSQKQPAYLSSLQLPLVHHTRYIIKPYETCLQLTNHVGNVLPSSLGVPRHNLHQHSSQPLRPPLAAPSPHRPLCRSLSPQDPILPLPRRILVVQYCQLNHLALPDLLYGTQ